MTPLMNALACLLSLSFANLLWKKLDLFKESILLVVFLLVSILFTFFSLNELNNPLLEHYPFRMLAFCLCVSTTSLKHKRRRYLVMAQLFWLWIELFGGISLYYRGFEIPWIRITALACFVLGSSFLAKIDKNMEFCLLVFWIATWIFF